MLDFLKSFRAQLTPPEWDSIMALQPDEAAMEAQFQRLWSLKEAYSKALGLGLAAPLGKASFSISPDSSCASLCLSGAEREDWAFRLHKLPQGHWAAVARAPPAQIVDAHGVFSATLTRTDFEPEEWRGVLTAPEPAFALVPVCSLLPTQCLDNYEAAGGDIY
ncbi:hypothetical protein ACKKBF_B18030 [Auxenochlorella protothecoides x Auxenochlorella symbiontica]